MARHVSFVPPLSAIATQAIELKEVGKKVEVFERVEVVSASIDMEKVRLKGDRSFRSHPLGVIHFATRDDEQRFVNTCTRA